MNNPTVLLIINSLTAGGAERVTVGLYNFLNKHGFDAHLFVTSRSSRSKEVYSVEVLENLHSGGRSLNKIVRAQENIRSLSILLRHLKPSWVISLGASYGLLGACGVYRKAKTVLSERNWPPSFYSAKELRRVSKIYRKADVVVFQTDDAAKCFSKDIQEKGIVIPNPAPSNLPEWTGEKSRNIIYYGRLDIQKNPQMAIKAFAKFSETHTDYSLEVYGAGSEKETLIRLSGELGVLDKVSFYAPSKSIHDIASKSLMYVNTSEYEGISNAVLEALSMGMPCVCTDCLGGGTRLLIQNDFNGKLVQRDDYQAMARAMEDIADDASFSRRLSSNARESISLFSESSIFSKWIDILNNI